MGARLATFLCLVLTGLSSVNAWAQIDSLPKVHARLIAEGDTVAPGGKVTVALEENIREGWAHLLDQCRQRRDRVVVKMEGGRARRGHRILARAETKSRGAKPVPHCLYAAAAERWSFGNTDFLQTSRSLPPSGDKSPAARPSARRCRSGATAVFVA